MKRYNIDDNGLAIESEHGIWVDYGQAVKAVNDTQFQMAMRYIHLEKENKRLREQLQKQNDRQEDIDELTKQIALMNFQSFT